MANLLKLFPVPKLLSFDPVGIDISNRVIRVLRLKQSKYGLIPDIYKEILLEEACDLLETEKDLESCISLRNALKQLKKEFDLKFVSVSLPETKTYIFKTTLPVEALPTIEDALVIKVQENVPLNIENLVFDFEIQKATQGSSEQINVVVTALPKEVISTYTTLFMEEGMFPIFFESESHSVTRAVVKKNDNTPYLLINFEYTKINLTIVEHGIVNYTSSIPYSSEEIIKDFNGKEAQGLKTKINQLLVYWFTNKKDLSNDEKISNVILVGPFATAPGMISFLERGLHINVSIADVWKNCFDLDKYTPNINYKTSIRYGTSIGLSLINK